MFKAGFSRFTWVMSMWRRTLLVAAMVACLSKATIVTAQMPPTTGPNIYLQEPQAMTATYSGSASATQALVSGQVQPLSLASGDFYQEGVSALAAGYAGAGSGMVVIQRGNPEAYAPRSQASWQAIAQGQFPAPFLNAALVFQTPERPDFLASGTLTGSDHLDLVSASRMGSTLYVFPGDGHGNFASPKVIAVPGTVTSLASGQFGSASRFTSLLVGINTPTSSAVLLYRGSPTGLSLIASFPLTGPASTFAFADLDGDSLPDAAIISAGQLVIMHAAAGSATPRLEALFLPFSASAIALGSFVHDRAWRQQMAVLASDGSLYIVAHGGFDSRGWTKDELRAMRQAVLQKKPNPLARPPFTPVSDGWKVVENFPGIAPFADSVHPPLFYRMRISGHSADDVMIINHETGQTTMVSHPNVSIGATSFTPGQTSIRAYSAGLALAGLVSRVNIDGRAGLVVLHQGQVGSSVMLPIPDPTFIVNTTNDTVDVNPGDGICADSQGKCSLRAAVMEANATAGQDTIMVPAGTFTLTIPSLGIFPGDASNGHLDINDGVNVVGAGADSTIIVGQAGFAAVDKVFSIGLSGASFDTAFSNLTLQSGQAPAADPVGGAFDWDAGPDGTGSLTLANVNITNSFVNDATLPSLDDGGGVFLSNEADVPSVVTISNSTIQNNLALDGGGGISMIGFVALTMTNSQLLNNRAQGAGAQEGGGIASFFNGTAAGSALIHGGKVSGNFAGSGGNGQGGGIWTQQPLTIDQSTVISGNQAGSSGGGLWSDLTNGAVSVTTATISGNSTAGPGGGIQVQGSSSTNSFGMNFSRIAGNNAAMSKGLNNVSGNVTASDNWWGCNEGPTPASNATTTVKIFGTGVASVGVLAADGSSDTHYNLVGSPDPTALGPGATVANSNAFPIPPWLSNGPNSKWIAPLPNAGASINPGTYVYQTTFDLTGLNPSTVTLSGQWAADNAGTINLNGVAVPNSTASIFAAFSPFAINNGFVNGVNTLDFQVTNAGSTANPTGFRAEISGSGTSTSACDLVTGTAIVNPWITLSHKPSTNPIGEGGATQLTASFLQDSAGGTLSPANLSTLIGLPVTFSNAVNGSLSNIQTTIQSSGTATATFTAPSSTSGPVGHADAKVDSATAAATIALSDFSVVVSAASQTVNVGTAATLTDAVFLSEINGFSSPISLSCTAPAGVTASCSPNSVSGAGASTLTIGTTSTTGPGSYTISVMGTGGGISHSASTVLNVADYSISLAPASVSVNLGQLAVYTVTCSTSTGFSGPVTLSTPLSGAVFSNNPLNCPGASGLTLNQNASGVFDVAVSGMSGSATRTAHSTLHVLKACLSPTSLTFASQPINTTSPAQSVTLTNCGADTLPVASISNTGDFSQINNCPSSLGINASCTITVKFTPTTTGSRTGTLSVSDSVPGPFQISLSGTGAPPASGAVSISGHIFCDGGCDVGTITITITALSSGGQPISTTRFTEPYDGFGLNGAADPQHIALAFARDFNGPLYSAQAVMAPDFSWQIQFGARGPGALFQVDTSVNSAAFGTAPPPSCDPGSCFPSQTLSVTPPPPFNGPAGTQNYTGFLH